MIRVSWKILFEKRGAVKFPVVESIIFDTHKMLKRYYEMRNAIVTVIKQDQVFFFKTPTGRWKTELRTQAAAFLEIKEFLFIQSCGSQTTASTGLYQ